MWKELFGAVWLRRRPMLEGGSGRIYLLCCRLEERKAIASFRYSRSAGCRGSNDAVWHVLKPGDRIREITRWDIGCGSQDFPMSLRFGSPSQQRLGCGIGKLQSRMVVEFCRNGGKSKIFFVARSNVTALVHKLLERDHVNVYWLKCNVRRLGKAVCFFVRLSIDYFGLVCSKTSSHCMYYGANPS